MGRSGLMIVVLAAASLVAADAQSPWRAASPGRAIVLPADHASHPDYKLEWWYYTGNVETVDRRRFGYQLTFFRLGVDAVPVNPSRWAIRDLHMAHLAVTDVQGRRYRFSDRLNRSGPGWAGAALDRLRVWNEDWRAEMTGPRHRLVAEAPGLGVNLELLEDRPPVRHGRAGYSQKGAAPDNASHYYSLTRMPTRGQLTIDGTRVDVSGASWMDHEFGTSFLETGQVGWDWFSVQLSDGRDLMVFQLRRSDGSIDPRSSGTLVERDGTTRPITASGLRLRPGRVWTSSSSGARYPVEWQIDVPSERLQLQVRAALDAQELDTARSTGVIYWEGAIDVSGPGVTGRGYLEMTGYTGAPMSRYLR